MTARFLRAALAIAAVVTAACTPEVPKWLAQRGQQERRIADASSVMHDFRFTDRRESSGITFKNQIVDDAGKTYKLVHYDHGSGICAADVDGDQRPDLYFLTQLGPNELWRNLGDARFENSTAAAGIAMVDAIAVGCAFADIDNDGDPDLFVTTVRHGNRLFENLGKGKFRDITADAGVGYVGHSAGATFFDYDRDGRLDLFVANVGTFTSENRGPGGYFVGLDDAFLGHLHPDRAEASLLYRNLGGNRFKDVTRETQLNDLSWSGDATVLDANADDFPDLYILDMQGTNHLWLNEGGKRFRDATSTHFRRRMWGGMGAKVFDANGDGRLDLFLTSMHSDMWADLAEGDWQAETRKADWTQVPPQMIPGGKSTLIFGNALYDNLGNGQFQEVSDSMGVETYWPWGPSVDDFNADGWDDIFVAAGMNYPFRYGINSLLLNEQGRRFLPMEFVLGIEPRARGAMEQVWYTLECGGADRDNPLCQDCRHSPNMKIQCRPDGTGRVAVTGALGTRSAVALDLDGDGDVDLVTNEFNAGPQVLLSDLAQRHQVRFLKVVPGALGAQVTAILRDGRRILKVYDGKSGYLSQSHLPLYFGLGTADTLESLEVRWPGGKLQTIAGPIKSGQTVDIVERER
jgi:hypothetical protein